MSLNTDLDNWVLLAQERYPTLNENEIKSLRSDAAIDWYSGVDTELADLFDQYVMLKNLKGM